MPPPNLSSHSTSPSDSSCVGSLPDKQSTNGDLNTKELRDIHQALPDSTHAERQRFLTDRKGDTKAAIDKLRNYLSWRKQHCNDDLSHLDSWTYATQLAVQTSGKGGDEKSRNYTKTLKLPCTLFLQEHEQSASDANMVDKTITNKKYLQLLPARIDTKLADTSIYALTLAIYLDHALDRTSTEKVTLVIDVRSGHGWANIKAVHLLPFIQSTARLLCDLYPLRLEQCIVFPVPNVASVLWKAVKPFMGKDTRKKVCLVSGPAGRNEKVPKKLSEYLDEGLITKLEERRTSCFVR
mmetsp:Transcript_10601/g.23436  ORF Transcript_10601/g.23436 Transcript_10601/m.23436 type:complete len:295 (-) Transcript_10601:357-1241(-)|eukprot:CAMPEP_0172314148 /NCGR_PEP_ID=MMETSP1058-20130122/21793_1 /TAXON_ID=83371 /ORGANISM="Detonula confervacea, Strain CCMP 353" /LENGTH=294 /DNA_ID=CAMNT_0013027935 /DNA_START=227 /DNA_END=1111 /DNA_ORIENTATION=+